MTLVTIYMVVTMETPVEPVLSHMDVALVAVGGQFVRGQVCKRDKEKTQKVVDTPTMEESVQ